MVDPHDDAYKAIGRYVVLFSQIVANMRNLLATRIAGQGEEGDEHARDLLEYAFGSLTAEPVANAFFAASRTLIELDQDEKAIEACLRKAVLAEIARRNDLLHGDWLFDELGEGSRATLLRVKAGSVKEPFRFNTYTAEQIEGMCVEADALRKVVFMFAHVTLQPHGDDAYEWAPARVRDAFEVVDGKVAFRPGVVYPGD
jgi:hypothetical protein